jgi:hypothetical protein
MTEDTPQKIDAPNISRAIFGATLVYDGAGYYPGIELLNLVFSSGSDKLLPANGPVLIRRRAHDFARKLVWSEEEFAKHPLSDAFTYDNYSIEALRRLLECLQLEIPSLRKRPTWERAHFFPYTRSLIHWDARKGRRNDSSVGIERRYLRGGGAFAFNVLRDDSNPDRLEKVRNGFRNLYEATDLGALEQLSSTLASKGYEDPEARTDEMISLSLPCKDELEEIYREGTASILSHDNLASVIRIRSLICWTAFWLVLIEHVKASEILGQGESYLICDCASKYPQLRRVSQRCLKEKQSLIVEASDRKAEELGGKLAATQRNQIRSFFWASAATIGLLNAWRGRRHFTLSIELIEALVMASTARASEITFESFLHDHLFRRCGLVIGRTSAEQTGLLSSIDASVFEDNENHLARQMSASGFLTQYSDATRMVGTGAVT